MTFDDVTVLCLNVSISKMRRAKLPGWARTARRPHAGSSATAAQPVAVGSSDINSQVNTRADDWSQAGVIGSDNRHHTSAARGRGPPSSSRVAPWWHHLWLSLSQFCSLVTPWGDNACQRWDERRRPFARDRQTETYTMAHVSKSSKYSPRTQCWYQCTSCTSPGGLKVVVVRSAVATHDPLLCHCTSLYNHLQWSAIEQ